MEKTSRNTRNKAFCHLYVRLELPARGGAVDEDGVVVVPLSLDANAVLRSDDLRLDPRVAVVEGQPLDPCSVVVGKSAAELIRVISNLT